MTLAEFGERMGALGFPLSRQTVWKIENGERPLGLDELFAAAYVLGTFPIALVDPGDDDHLRVGEGVEIDEDELAGWMLCTEHPAVPLTTDEAKALMPSAVRDHWTGLEVIMQQRDGLRYVVDRIAASLKTLPREEYEEITTALGVVEEETHA